VGVYKFLIVSLRRRNLLTGYRLEKLILLLSLILRKEETEGMEGWTEEEIRDKNLMAPCGL